MSAETPVESVTQGLARSDRARLPRTRRHRRRLADPGLRRRPRVPAARRHPAGRLRGAERVAAPGSDADAGAVPRRPRAPRAPPPDGPVLHAAAGGHRVPGADESAGRRAVRRAAPPRQRRLVPAVVRVGRRGGGRSHRPHRGPGEHGQEARPLLRRGSGRHRARPATALEATAQQLHDRRVLLARRPAGRAGPAGQTSRRPDLAPDRRGLPPGRDPRRVHHLRGGRHGHHAGVHDAGRMAPVRRRRAAGRRTSRAPRRSGSRSCTRSCAWIR